MSDTPRTDEQINGKPCTRFAILAGDSLRDALVPSEFARGLERELDSANDRIKRLEDRIDLLMSANADVARITGERDKAEKRVLYLESALRKIANQDYRGNRSTESQIAFEALKP